MRLSHKEWQLLQALQNHSQGYITSKQLAQQLRWSDKTVGKYVARLSEVVAHHGARIDRIQGRGYQLSQQDSVVFATFLAKQTPQQAEGGVPDEPLERQRYVLQQLFFGQKQVTVATLKASLFVSRTTVMTVLADIKQRLAAYQLQLHHSSDKGLVISGSEQDKRRFMRMYFFDQHNKEVLASYVSQLDQHSDVPTETLAMIVLDACREGQLMVFDYVINNLVVHLWLMLRRLRAGHVLEQFALPPELVDAQTTSVAKRIAARVMSECDVLIPEEEANYIALHLSGTTGFSSNLPADQHLLPQLQQAIKRFGAAIGLPQFGDATLLHGLQAHFGPLLLRLRNGLDTDNPLLADIRDRYHQELFLTQDIFAQMPALRGQYISDDEWAYIAMHVIAALERHSNRQRKRVLVICATGYGSAQMLHTRLLTEFGHQIEQVTVSSYYELHTHDLQDIDVIISSVPLDSSVFAVPVVTVHVLLPEEDVQRLRPLFGAGRIQVASLPPSDCALQQAAAIFDRLFQKSAFLEVTEQLNRQQLLRRMVACLPQDTAHFADQMLRQLDLRESMASVVFHQAVAFPHPAEPLSAVPRVVVASCVQGVTWNQEQTVVRLVCLLSPARTGNRDMMFVSRAFGKLMRNIQGQQQLAAVTTLEQLRQLLLPYIEQERIQ